MIALFYTQLDQQYFDNHYTKYFDRLTPEMHKKIAAYKFTQDKGLFLTGKILLLKGLDYMQINHLNLFDLGYNEYRKPYFEDSIFFNISHSNEYVICAISKHYNVGVDLEYKGFLEEYPIKQIFTQAEESIFSSIENKQDFFYYVWTRKEALLKASGKGLSNDLTILEILKSPVSFENTAWTLHTQALNANYIYSIAFNSASSPLIKVEFSPCLKAIMKTDKSCLVQSNF